MIAGIDLQNNGDIMACDIIISGSGAFAARIAFDIAATARARVSVIIASRNKISLDWIVTAANARAKIFHSQAKFISCHLDLLQPDAASQLLVQYEPRIFVQAASVQTSSIIAKTGDAWSALVREGGLSATALAQSAISLRVARAITGSGRPCHFINCSFPDVVNEIIAAEGHSVLCGLGNVGILSSVFAGILDIDQSRIRVLAHYQNLAAFRQLPNERYGRAPRVWIDNQEITNVFDYFHNVKLTPEPVIDISGATGVPLILALSQGHDWSGHLPGPNGLPGGYPVRLKNTKIELDLPAGMSPDEAIQWNRQYELENGLIVDQQKRVHFTGLLQSSFKDNGLDFSDGFSISDIDSVYLKIDQLRKRLENI